MKTQIYTSNKPDRVISKATLGRLRRSLESMPEHQTTLSLRKQILSVLHQSGWSGNTRIDASSKISVTAMNGGVALCLQTGNMGRLYADLLKLQCLYKKRSASAGIYLVLTSRAAKQLGSNLVNFERLTTEINIFRGIISIPLVVIGLDGRLE